jgi:dethiobiotin synthetase
VTEYLVITGTGTGVGKTIVTAALAAVAARSGRRVAVVKPVQTGLPPGAPGDVDDVARLSGVARCHELVRFPDPLAPEAAARVAGLPPADLPGIARWITTNLADADLVLVEGAGGLLVRFDPRGGTMADLAGMLRARVLVVADPALGTLNHTALTLAALAARRLPVAGVVLGSWPAEPDLACRTNLTDLPVVIGGPLMGAIPAGAGVLPPADFAAIAEAGLAPSLGGRFNGIIDPAPL